MGSSTVIIVIIFFLDLIAFGLGIGAEQRRATGTKQSNASKTYQWCSYTSDIASGLGAGALLFLLTSQVVLIAATRCLCCGSSLKPGAARAFAIIFFILNWVSFIVAGACFLAGAVQNAKHTRVSFIVAGACFLAGAVQNAKHTRYLSYFGTVNLTCEAIRKDTFAAGVAFTFFTFILSIAYYLCCSKAQEGSWKNQFNRGEAGVNMASYA